MAIITPTRMASAFSAGWFPDELGVLRYQFRQAGKPTARPNGSALQAGDRWIEVETTGNLVEWQWYPEINGGSWAGSSVHVIHTPNGAPSYNAPASTTVDSGFTILNENNLFIRQIACSINVSSANATNYWTFRLECSPFGGVNVAITPQIVKNTPGQETFLFAQNLFLDLVSLNYKVFRMPVYSINSPGTVRAIFNVQALTVKV